MCPHEPIWDRRDGRSPLSPSPSWLTETGTITDCFPISLSTHRNAELYILAVVFFPSVPTLAPVICREISAHRASAPAPEPGGAMPSAVPRLGDRRSCGPVAAISTRTRGWRRHGFANTGGERQGDCKKLLAVSREGRRPYMAGSGPTPPGQMPGSSGDT